MFDAHLRTAAFLAAAGYGTGAVLELVHDQPATFTSTIDYLIEAGFVVGLTATVVVLAALVRGQRSFGSRFTLGLAATGNTATLVAAGGTLILGREVLDGLFFVGVLATILGYLASAVLDLLREGKPFTRENLDATYVARRRRSWVESEARVAEKSRDGFQQGVVQGMIGMALTGLTKGLLHLGPEPVLRDDPARDPQARPERAGHRRGVQGRRVDRLLRRPAADQGAQQVGELPLVLLVATGGAQRGDADTVAQQQGRAHRHQGRRGRG